MTSALFLLLGLINNLHDLLYFVAGICGVVGAVFVASTRSDAFPAADRQSKWTWFALLMGSAVVCVFVGGAVPLISIAGVVIIGLYWWDLRPQLNDLLGGTQGSW
ncbi:DUF2516 family protein [Corynebacterium lowii]|uniref:DUF2516 domain-containing protein n=1 Tax=Corynebacterium lowii TaxID=1544413 RepID=A0A0Q0UG60_9CORY|nr:DUF2516 family protein [Corynebacterium lowii]KQB87278.1 hypothetical protein Clow_00333 [Corynebacterium lowii]MDP9852134.1 ABC-type antimicrobial peptide transport system permease subunit [Corynebacterium lowii]